MLLFFAIGFQKKGDNNMEKKPENGHYIFVKYYRNVKTGKIMYASAYGKKAFKLWIRDN